MKNIVFRAPLLSISGYGVHARQIAEWLLDAEKKNPDLKVFFHLVKWGDTAWHVNHNGLNGLVREILMRASRPPEGTQFDVSLQLQLPDEWDPFLANKNIGITAGVEATKCNPAWIDAINRMDLVVVPSEFTKSVFTNSGNVQTPVAVVPESFIPECRNPESVPDLELNLSTNFNFLIVSQFTGNNPENDRKNLAYTIKWMLENFKDDPDVGIIIKTNFGRQTSIDKQKCINALGQLVMQCQAGPGPKIHLLHGHMTNEEMVGLYKHPKVKALVSLTRGEGFGLPILEAAACGLPVIATGWSAHTEFLKLGKYVKVDFDIHKVHPSRVDGRIFISDAEWANPDEKDAKRKLTRFKNGSSIPAGWAKELKEKLLKAYDIENIKKSYSDALDEIVLGD